MTATWTAASIDVVPFALPLERYKRLIAELAEILYSAACEGKLTVRSSAREEASAPPPTADFFTDGRIYDAAS